MFRNKKNRFIYSTQSEHAQSIRSILKTYRNHSESKRNKTESDTLEKYYSESIRTVLKIHTTFVSGKQTESIRAIVISL